MATILIADDNADIRELVNLQLQKHGFSCLEVFDGSNVMEALNTHAIDLILMDMNMPELDGWEATSAIRGHENFKNIPIIALTAYSLDGDRARAEAAGCNAFHCKPVEFEALLATINKLLETQTTSS